MIKDWGFDLEKKKSAQDICVTYRSSANRIRVDKLNFLVFCRGSFDRSTVSLSSLCKTMLNYH